MINGLELYHLSFVTCHSSLVIRHLSFVTCHLSFVTCHLSFVTCHLSLIKKTWKLFLFIKFFCFTFAPENKK